MGPKGARREPALPRIAPPGIADSDPLWFRIISHNIGYATQNTIRYPNELSWSQRRPEITAQLMKYADMDEGATFICLQAVQQDEVLDILHDLNEASDFEWDVIGVFDGYREETNAIIYGTWLFKSLRSKVIWLSDTPDQPSKDEVGNAQTYRSLTMGVFEEKSAQARFIACCTQLSDESPELRKRNVQHIMLHIEAELEQWKQREDYEGMRVFLVGDFNATDRDEVYRLLTDGGTFDDLREAVPVAERYGDGDTFTGFDGQGDGGAPGRTSFIFLGEGDMQYDPVYAHWKFRSYTVAPNVVNGVYLSNHRAVVGEVELWSNGKCHTVTEDVCRVIGWAAVFLAVS